MGDEEIYGFMVGWRLGAWKDGILVEGDYGMEGVGGMKNVG